MSDKMLVTQELSPPTQLSNQGRYPMHSHIYILPQTLYKLLPVT